MYHCVKLIDLEKQLKKAKNTDAMKALLKERNKVLNKIFKEYHCVADVFLEEYTIDTAINLFGVHKNNLIICSLPIQFVLDPRQYTFKFKYDKNSNRDIFSYTFKSIHRRPRKICVEFCCIETDKYEKELHERIFKLKDRLCELLKEGGND